MADPTLTLEAAFDANPFVTSPTWTDISADLRSGTIKRGSSGGHRDRIRAGTATFILNNHDAAYSPWNTVNNMKPMSRIRLKATHSAVDYEQFEGFIESVRVQWLHDNYSTAEIRCVDGFKALSLHNTANAQVEELTGTRIGNWLDDASWPTAWRNLDAGSYNAVAHTPNCEQVLGLIEDTALLERPNGRFFIAKNGQATFYDNTFVYPALVTYGDGGGAELPYESLDVDWDDSQIWNEVTAVATDGSALSSDDATSQGKYFKRTLKYFEAHARNTTDLQAVADALVAEYKDPTIRISRIVINPRSDESLWAAVLGDELGQPIRVIRRPASGPTLTQDLSLAGYTLTFSPKQWLMTYDLGQV